VTIGPATGMNLPLNVDITTTLLPNGRVKDAYLQTLTAVGGVGTLTFTVSSGTLPPGLTMATDGTISGIPTASGLYTFSVDATDSGTPASVDTQALQILVNKRPSDKDEGCTTGEGQGQGSWLVLAGLVSLLVISLRRRSTRRA